jgi:hypothetical protein
MAMSACCAIRNALPKCRPYSFTPLHLGGRPAQSDEAMQAEVWLGDTLGEMAVSGR